MRFDRTPKEIMDFKTAISDTYRFTSSSAPISCVDPDHGRIYCAYLASRTCYGEAYDFVVLAVIPVAQPEKTHTFIVAEKGTIINGVQVGDLIDCNIVRLEDHSRPYTVRTHFATETTLYKDVIRIHFLNIEERTLYYRDFDPELEEFSSIKPCKAILDNTEMTLNDKAMQAYLISRKLIGHNIYSGREPIMSVSKLIRNTDGFYYGFLTSSYSQPISFRTRDTVTFELLGHIDAVCEYEAASALLGGKFYALLRAAKADNFFISTDMGKTFQPCGRLNIWETRPQMIPYCGKLLIGWSEQGRLPNLARDGRNNVHLMIGSGPDLSQYEEVLYLQDEKGLVYFDLNNYKGTVYMIWSNGDLYLDKNPQAKDLLYYSRIGTLREENRV